MAFNKEQALQDALDAYDRREYPSIRAAAKAFNVNHGTLARRINGGLSRQQAHEAEQLLSPDQERLLVRWILDLEVAGAPPTFAQVREFAGLVSQASGGPPSVGVNWISGFLNRHPDVRSKVGQKMEYLRIENTSPEALQIFFDLFLAVVQRHSIRTENQWNFDETGIAMGICSNQRVLGTTETKRSYVKSPENREWGTIIEAGSAVGRTIDPLILFKGQNL